MTRILLSLSGQEADEEGELVVSQPNSRQEILVFLYFEILSYNIIK